MCVLDLEEFTVEQQDYPIVVLQLRAGKGDIDIVRECTLFNLPQQSTPIQNKIHPLDLWMRYVGPS